MNEIDRCLERCEAGLMALCHTGDVERIIEEYEEEMKSRKEQWNAIFSQYAAAEGKKKKEEPLQRGRFVVAEVNFAGRDGMSLLETVCAVISVNKERITVLAHLPNVTPSLLPQAQLLSVPEDAVIICAHIGGEARRGDTSDPFIEMVMPLSDALIAVEGGNADGKLTQLADQEGIPYGLAFSIAGSIDIAKDMAQ